MKILGVAMQDKTALIIGGVGLLIAYSAYTKAQAVLADPSGFGAGLGQGAVDLTSGVIGGAVVGIGSIFGIPKTDKAQCIADITAGNTWASSWSCDVGTFFRSLGGTDQALSAGGANLADSKVVQQPWYDPFGLLGK